VRLSACYCHMTSNGSGDEEHRDAIHEADEQELCGITETTHDQQPATEHTPKQTRQSEQNEDGEKVRRCKMSDIARYQGAQSIGPAGSVTSPRLVLVGEGGVVCVGYGQREGAIADRPAESEMAPSMGDAIRPANPLTNTLTPYQNAPSFGSSKISSGRSGYTGETDRHRHQRRSQTVSQPQTSGRKGFWCVSQSLVGGMIVVRCVLDRAGRQMEIVGCVQMKRSGE